MSQVLPLAVARGLAVGRRHLVSGGRYGWNEGRGMKGGLGRCHAWGGTQKPVRVRSFGVRKGATSHVIKAD